MSYAVFFCAAVPGLSLVVLTLGNPAWWARPFSLWFTPFALALMVALSVRADTSQGGFRVLSMAWTVGAVIQSGVALAQFLRQGSLGLAWLGEPQWELVGDAPAIISAAGELWGRSPGLTTHPNHLGAYLAVGIVCTVSQSVAARGWRRPLLLGALALVTAGELTTFSRGSWIASFVALGAALTVTALREPRSRRLAALNLAVIAATVAAFVSVYPQLFATRTLVLASSLGWEAIPYEVVNLDQRQAAFWQAVAIVRQQPLLGLGLGRTAWACKAYRSGSRSTWALWAHCYGSGGPMARWGMPGNEAWSRTRRAPPPAVTGSSVVSPR